MRVLDGSEDGFTLVEIIVGLVIIAVVVVGIVAGLGAAISTTRLHRQQATAQTILVNAAESIKRQTFDITCPVTYNPVEGVDLYSASGTNWDVTIAEIEFWDTTSDSWTSSCAADRLQKVTLQILENGVPKPQETTSVVKRPS